MKQAVYDLLLTIPAGKVTTYGHIAQALGNRHLARAVGNILHANPDPVRYPCYKVVSGQGKLAEHFAFGGKEGQKRRLEQEGIEVVDFAVDLKKYGYFPTEK